VRRTIASDSFSMAAFSRQPSGKAHDAKGFGFPDG